MKAAIVIPARWASTRFPGKPLAMIAGTSLIQRVYERAVRSRKAGAVFVATDDTRIADHVRAFGGAVVEPQGDFQTGTDRIAAALPLLGGDYTQVVNVQGDEPLIDVAAVDAIIDVLQEDRFLGVPRSSSVSRGSRRQPRYSEEPAERRGTDIATLAAPIETDDERLSRDVVKVVTALNGYALYFSRAPLAGAQRHVGIYGYQTAVLKQLASLAPSPLEIAESLEQLRALQNGFKIRVVQTTRPHLGVDRPEDVARVEYELAKHV